MVESRFLEFHFTLYCNSFKAFSSLATFLTGSTGILSRPNIPNIFLAYTRLYLAYHWHFVLLFFLTEELSTQVSNYEFKNQSDHTCIRKQVITQWWEWNPQISKPTRRGFNEGVKKLQLIPLLFHLPLHPPVTWTLSHHIIPITITSTITTIHQSSVRLSHPLTPIHSGRFVAQLFLYAPQLQPHPLAFYQRAELHHKRRSTMLLLLSF